MTYAAGPQMYRTRRQVRRWSVGHHAPSQSRVVASPGPSVTHGVGALSGPLVRRRGHTRAVGAERHAQHSAAMGQHGNFFSCLRIPQPSCPIVGSRRHTRAVWVNTALNTAPV